MKVLLPILLITVFSVAPFAWADNAQPQAKAVTTGSAMTDVAPKAGVTKETKVATATKKLSYADAKKACRQDKAELTGNDLKDCIKKKRAN